MKLIASIIIGFTAGLLIGYCAFRDHSPRMHATVELRDRERHELKTDHL